MFFFMSMDLHMYAKPVFSMIWSKADSSSQDRVEMKRGLTSHC